ncbi:MAG TPA: uroporphyrinogen decarboxylase family protein [Candidatus Brocadiia bacterium]|nr:uroporphyrinogen decarboxylase family protein [Candidatus Brocadiia bacterium]
MISGKENYQRAIEFRSPERLPIFIQCSFNGLRERNPEKERRIFELQSRIPDDIVMFNEAPPFLAEPRTEGGATRWTDQWGTGWISAGHGNKTERYPLEAGYHLLKDYVLPDPHDRGRFAKPDEILSKRGDRYALAMVWFTLFERLWMLRGFENMLTDPYDNEDGFCALRDRIVAYNLAMIDQWLERGVDGIYFSDDWGCQRGLLINPDDWRKWYKPSYDKMFRRVHDGGACVWMHLCGDITPILPDLIELGLQVLNPVQPQAMDIRQLARDFGGRLCFFGGVDVQGTLIRGTPEDVKREARELVELFGMCSSPAGSASACARPSVSHTLRGYRGGYIAGTSHTIMPETPLDNIIAMYESFVD